MPAFFETFPVILIDKGGTFRGDIPFRRVEFRYSIEQVKISIYFNGGVLNNSAFRPSVVKSFIRKHSLARYLPLIRDPPPMMAYFVQHQEVGIVFLI